MGFKSNRDINNSKQPKPQRAREDIFRKKDFLIHRSTIDKIDQILISGKIETLGGTRGISLTEGITPIPGHGGTAIVFKKGFVGRAGSKATRVDYDNNDHIERFGILEPDFQETYNNQKLEEADFMIKHSQIYVESIGTQDVVDNHNKLLRDLETQGQIKKSRKAIRSDLLRQFRQWENEVYVHSNKLVINNDEIIAIIAPYRFYLQYFKGIEMFLDKCIFLDDIIRLVDNEIDVLGLRFCPHAQKRIDAVDKMRSREKLFRSLRDYSLASYHVAHDLIGNDEMYKQIQGLFPENKMATPPKILLDYLLDLSKLPNDFFKSKFIDYLGTRLTKPVEGQDSGSLIENLDQFYISEIESRLS